MMDLQVLMPLIAVMVVMMVATIFYAQKAVQKVKAKSDSQKLFLRDGFVVAFFISGLLILFDLDRSQDMAELVTQFIKALFFIIVGFALL